MSERSHRHFREMLFSSTMCAALAVMVVPVQAQTVAANGPAAAPVEEVTVTAERRTEDIQKATIAITAISGDELQKSDVVQLADINGLVPSLSVARSAGFETIVTVRGIGDETPENSLTTSPGIATYIDGAYVANSITLDETLFDVDHVEVLRGPQGALYGESATGGAVLLVTKQASLDGGTSGDVSASYGTYNLNQEDFDLNVPVSDTLAVHLAVNGSPAKYLLIEDPIPAGTEFVQHEDSYNILDQPAAWQYWYTRREFYDDRAAIFATESTGRHESFYLLKVVNPGSFAISPANVQPMYQPGIQATSDLLHLQVDAAPSPGEDKK